MEIFHRYVDAASRDKISLSTDTLEICILYLIEKDEHGNVTFNEKRI